MNRIVIATLCALLFTGMAQAATIKGQIIDQKSKEKLEFVTVALVKQGETTARKGATSDQQGNFQIENITTGKYTLKIVFMGYSTIERSVEFNNNRKTLDLGVIALQDESKRLQEVQIVAQQSQMKLEVDKKVFSVDQNIASAGGSASEALQNIPSVDVDTEGNISLRNSSNVVVWINGRPAGLSEENRAQILEQMPAESIESIEVITNPSAKFSAEGSAGIINLVLKKERKVGYYGSVSAGMNSRLGYNVGGNINVMGPKFEGYLNLGLRSMRFDNWSNSDRDSWVGTDTTRLIQRNVGDMNGLGLFARAGVAYNMTDNDRLGISATAMIGDRNQETTQKSYNGLEVLQKERLTLSDGGHNMIEGAIDYTHTFSKVSDLRLYASIDYMDRSSKGTYDQKNFLSNGGIQPSLQKQNDINKSTDYLFQADYVNQFGKDMKFEAGYKGTIDNRSSRVETLEGTNENDLQPNDNLYNVFTYEEQVHALYATLTGKVGKFSYQAGIRGEYMRYYSTTESSVGTTPYLKEYFEPFPTAFIAYELPDKGELQLNYTRRVNRPRGRQVNSFRNITDSTNISFGNPMLKPEFTNSLEFNYLKGWEGHTLSLSAYYRASEGVIQRVSYFEYPTLYSTFENVSSSISSGLEIVAKNRIAKPLELTTSLNFYYYQQEGFSYQGTQYAGVENFAWNGRIIASAILPWSISLQVTANYRSAQKQAQGRVEDEFSLDFGIRKTFLDRKLILAITGRDILDSRKRTSYTWGNNFYQTNVSQFGGPTVGINLTYMFGTQNKNGKKSQRSNGQEDMNEMNDMMEF